MCFVIMKLKSMVKVFHFSPDVYEYQSLFLAHHGVGKKVLTSKLSLLNGIFLHGFTIQVLLMIHPIQAFAKFFSKL